MNVHGVDRPAPGARLDHVGSRLVLLGLALWCALGPVASVVAQRALGSLPILFGALVLAGLLLQRRGPVDRPLLLALGALAGVAALSALWAAYPGVSVFGALRTVLLVGAALVGAAALRLCAPGTIRRLAGTALAGLAVGWALLLLDLHAGEVVYRALRPSEAGDPVPGYVYNRAAVVLALLTVPGSLLLLRRSRPVALALPLAALVPLAMMESQTALLGAAAGGLVLLLAWWRPRPALALVTAAVVGSVAAAPLAIAALPDDAHAWTWLMESARHRLAIWQGVTAQVGEAPLLGHGVDAARGMLDLVDPDTGFPGAITHTHSSQLQIWLDLGAVGAGLLILLVVLVARRIARVHGEAQPFLTATLAATGAVAAVGYGLWQGAWLGTVATTAVFAALALRAHETGALARRT